MKWQPTPVFLFGKSQGQRSLTGYSPQGRKELEFPGGSVGKNPPAKQETACNVGDTGLIPGSGKSPGEGNGNPLQYSYLGNPTDRGAWWTTAHGVAKESDKTQRLNSNNRYK